MLRHGHRESCEASCPFCRNILGDAREHRIPELIEMARDEGCHYFPTATTFQPMETSG